MLPNGLRSLQWEPQNSKDKKKRNLLYISYLQVWTTSEKICTTGCEDLTLLLMSPGGYVPMATMGARTGAFPLSSAPLPPVCSTSSHVNSSSNIFWGAQPKLEKPETQRGVWGSSTSVREPVLGTACRTTPPGILDQEGIPGGPEQCGASPWQMLALKQRRRSQNNNKKTDAAPVGQRFGLWRLRLLFTFNRTFPCASAAERMERNIPVLTRTTRQPCGTSAEKNAANDQWNENRGCGKVLQDQ